MSSKEEDESDKSKKRRKHRLNGFEQWGGYMAAKKMKLDAQFEGQKGREQEETKIFKGVAIFVNGYTNPSADELKRLMVLHGGKYHQYYSTSKTTHVIASNLPKSKMKNLKTQTIVTADWITESVKAGKRLPHQNFFLYPPEAVDKQPRLQVGKHFTAEVKSGAFAANEPTTSKGQEPSALTNILPDENYMEATAPEPISHLELNSEVQNSAPSSVSDSSLNSNTSKSPQKQGSAIKAGHPEFLSEFYNHSRLHHISTAGQELKRYVQYLAENNKEKHFPGREKLRNAGSAGENGSMFASSYKDKTKTQNVIMHLDMDCFFVSVGLKSHPHLKGFPVAVTHSKGKRGGPQEGSDIHFEASHYENESQKKLNGVISSKDKVPMNTSNEKSKVSIYSKEYGSLSEIASCSYEARKAGIRNGMFLGEALRRCPDLKTIPYDFEGYSEVSKQLYNIVASYTLDIEAVSCDELFIDCTELLQEIELSPYQFASILRSEIEEKTGCTASAGIGCNMLLARLANKVAKPNGQYYVSHSEIDEFMKKQKVGDLPGVGYTTSSKLKHLGIATCGDLQTWSLSKLQQEFGPKTGQSLFNRCRGKDNRTVQLHKDRKSVSAEINYGIRFETMDDAYNFINELAVEVQRRLQNIGSKGKALTLKLMARRPEAPVETAKFMGHGVCDHLSKSVLLKSATDSAKLIASECSILARSLSVNPQDYRGLGIQMSKLETVQEEKSIKTIESFLCQPKDESSTKNEPLSEVAIQSASKDGVFSPKDLKVINKPIPEKNTIKHFLSNQPSPQKKQSYNPSDYIPEQFDQSVLDALPEDLRKEILESYAAASKVTNGKVCTSVNLTSTRKTSTVMQNNSSKKSPSKVKDSNRKKVQVKETKKSENNMLDVVSTSPLEKKESVPTDETITITKASLGGAVEIDEIRSMIKEWILSTQEPLEEDINDLRIFLLHAVDEDPNKVKVVLRYIHRLASSANERWKAVYLKVLSSVQKRMVQMYGGILEAYNEFPT